MAKKEKFNRAEAESVKDDLEKLLDEITPENTQTETEAEIELPPIPMKRINYEELTERSLTKAKEMVASIVQYYLSDELQKDNYVHNKMELDILTVSNLLFQMETSEHAIKKLLFEIDMGNLHARMFEVLSGLQRSKMEIVKHLKQVEIIMENNYKSLMLEFENKLLMQSNANTNNENREGVLNNPQKQIGQGYNSIGTRKLLKDILADPEEEIEEADIIE